MAQLAIKVLDHVPTRGKSRDGDVLDAFNRRRCLWKGAHDLLPLKTAPLTSRGLRAPSLQQAYREVFCRYRTERISETEIRRTELATGTVEIFGPIENEKKERINVPRFVEGRYRMGERHALWGTPGREIWYGGGYDFSVENVNRMWSIIEATTGLSREDYTTWPFTPRERTSFLIVSTDDFDDAFAERVKATVPNPEGIKLPPILRSGYTVDWRSLVPPEDIPNVEDRSRFYGFEPYVPLESVLPKPEAIT